MAYAYILLCADGTYYAGSTTDIVRRVHEHNHTKQGAKYTKYRRPVTLHYLEQFQTLSEAKKREALFKKMSRNEKSKLIQAV